MLKNRFLSALPEQMNALESNEFIDNILFIQLFNFYAVWLDFGHIMFLTIY